MFNPATETGKGWDGDIRDDVILEVIFILESKIILMYVNHNFRWLNTEALCMSTLINIVKMELFMSRAIQGKVLCLLQKRFTADILMVSNF